MCSRVFARIVPSEVSDLYVYVPSLYPQLTLHLQCVTYPKTYIKVSGEGMTVTSSCARSEPEMAAFGDPPGVPGSSFFYPIACPDVQRANSANLDCELGAEACGRCRRSLAG
jgi:hypothetical protein